MKKRTRPLVLAACLAAWPVTALAQDPPQPPRKPSPWSLELYGGTTAANQPTGGTPIGDWPVGDTFLTRADQPSRFVSSWRFGDGAVLLNAALDSAGSLLGQPLPALVPLDDVLRAPGGRAGSSAVYGARLARRLTARWAIELSIERNSGGLTVDERWLNTLETARGSFERVFTELFATAPATGLAVESTLDVPVSSSSHTRLLIAATRTLTERGRWAVLATAGGGLQLTGGSEAEVSLGGRYSMLPFNFNQLVERDDIRIAFKEPSQTLVGLVGVGGRWAVNASTAVRLDIRMQLTPNRVTTEVRTLPFNGIFNSEPLETETTPGLQFSNAPSVRATLNGQSGAMTLTTFTGSGVSRRVAATLGLVMRF